MADLISNKPEQAVDGVRKSYGDTFVGDGAYAHLGDFLQQLQINGGLHLHIEALRKPTANKARAKPARKEYQESLRNYRAVLVAIADTSEDGFRNTDHVMVRCIQKPG